MNPRTKYPRSFHLPWSLGSTDDDKTLGSVKHFVGREVVVTEKLDGENTTVYSDSYMHARSIDGRSHKSQSRVRAQAAAFGVMLPDGWRICGENLFAEHSILYDRLTAYFYAFSVWTDANSCISWDELEMWVEELGVPTVPVLYRGVWDEDAVRACWTGKGTFSDEQEGYVVRLADKFSYDEFDTSLAKFVRANHVRTDRHWRHKPLVANKMACSDRPAGE